MHTWVPLFVLPNLLVKEPVEVEYVALVPPSDPRSEEIAKTNKNFYPFLNSFTDAFQRRVIPSVLIWRTDAPTWGNVDGGNRRLQGCYFDFVRGS